MSTRRRTRGSDVVAPRGICRWCKKPVEKPRISWCGDACVHEHRLRTNPAYLRARVLERDAGVCVVCGRDCAALDAELRALRHAPEAWRRGSAAHAVYAARVLALNAEGFSLTVSTDKSVYSTWQADHIVPVVEGGGECGMENMRTLCSPCHGRATKTLMGRLMQRRAS